VRAWEGVRMDFFFFFLFAPMSFQFFLFVVLSSYLIVVYQLCTQFFIFYLF
jgi:hypothetical protein